MVRLSACLARPRGLDSRVRVRVRVRARVRVRVRGRARVRVMVRVRVRAGVRVPPGDCGREKEEEAALAEAVSAEARRPG